MTHALTMVRRPLDWGKSSMIEEQLDFYGIPYSEFGGNAWFFDISTLSDTRKGILDFFGAVPVTAKIVNMTVIYTMMDVIEQVYFHDGERHLEMYGDTSSAERFKSALLIDDYYWFNTVETDWSIACDMLFYIVRKSTP